MASTRRPKVRRTSPKVAGGTSRPARNTLRLNSMSGQHHMLSPQAITSPVSTPRFRESPRASDALSGSLANDEEETDDGDTMESAEDVVYVHLHAPLEVIEREGTRAMDATHTSEARTADVAAALEELKDPGDVRALCLSLPLCLSLSLCLSAGLSLPLPPSLSLSLPLSLPLSYTPPTLHY